MADVINNACEALDNGKETLNDNEKSNSNDDITKSEALETKICSDVEMRVEVDGNADLSNPKKPSIGDLEILDEKLLTEEEMQTKRKRGRRGGRRRGPGPEKDDWCYPHGGSGSRTQITQRGERKGFRNQGTSNVTDVTKLPDGILLIEDDDYVGYHCTYCNCVLTSMAIVNSHVAGFRHKVILEVRNVEKKKKTEENLPQCELESSAERLENEGYKAEAGAERLENEGDKAEAGVGQSENEGARTDIGVEQSENESARTEIAESQEETVQNAESESSLAKDASFVPLKSSLEDYLTATSDPVIGLDYITEKVKQDGKSSFECRLCKVQLGSAEMKAHIRGTRHRLMYLKMKYPEKITELLIKNLQKFERIKEIRDCIEILMHKHGKGNIIVEHDYSTTITSEDKQRKRLSGAQRRKRRKADQPDPSPPKPTNNQSQRNNHSATGKSKRGSFYGTWKSKRASDRAYFYRKRHREAAFSWKQPFGSRQMSNREFTGWTSNPWMKPFDSDQFSSDIISNNLHNTGSSFESGQYFSNYSKNRQLYQSDEDNRRMDYSSDYSSYLSQDYTTKNRDQGSETDILKQLRPDIDVNNDEEAGVVMNVINSLTEQFLQYKLKNLSGPAKQILEKSQSDETLQHTLSNLTDENNIRAADRISSKSSARNRNIDNKTSYLWDDKTNSARRRDKRNQPQHDWDKEREATYTRNRMGKSVDYFEEERGTAYREKMNKSSHNLDEDRVIKSQKNFEDDSETTYPRGRTNQSLNDWGEIRDTVYPKDKMYKSQDNFNNIRGATYHKDRMSQPQREWNEDRGIKHPRDMMDQHRSDWNDTRSTTYVREVMDRPQHDWNENRDILFSKNTSDQPRDNWNGNEGAISRNTMDQPKRDWNEDRGTTSTRDVTDQYRHGWNETRHARSRNIHSLNQSFCNSNELKQASTMKNIASEFSRTQYGSGTNSGTFNNLPQTWNEKKDSPQQKSNTMSYVSYPQIQSSSIASQPLRKNAVHPSYVDDLFDKYQNEMKSEKTRNITNMDSENHSCTASNFKSSYNYMGSSATSSFNRSSSFGQLSSTASAARWKYASFK